MIEGWEKGRKIGELEIKKKRESGTDNWSSWWRAENIIMYH